DGLAPRRPPSLAAADPMPSLHGGRPRRARTHRLTNNDQPSTGNVNVNIEPAEEIHERPYRPRSRRIRPAAAPNENAWRPALASTSTPSSRQELIQDGRNTQPAPTPDGSRRGFDDRDRADRPHDRGRHARTGGGA